MSFFGTSGKNREMKWIVSIDDTKVKTGLQNVKRGFSELDTTTKGVTKNMGTATQQQFRAMDQEFKKTAQSLKQFEAEIGKEKNSNNLLVQN